ncbi:hypothetical protein H8959_003431 [Pygathrix nigripes]
MTEAPPQHLAVPRQSSKLKAVAGRGEGQMPSPKTQSPGIALPSQDQKLTMGENWGEELQLLSAPSEELSCLYSHHVGRKSAEKGAHLLKEKIEAEQGGRDSAKRDSSGASIRTQRGRKCSGEREASHHEPALSKAMRSVGGSPKSASGELGGPGAGGAPNGEGSNMAAGLAIEREEKAGD